MNLLEVSYKIILFHQAETFKGDDNPVIACKGCRLSDWGGRSLSLLASSQMIVNPDIREAALLKGWWNREGCNKEFQSFRSEGGSAGGKLDIKLNLIFH